MRRELNRIKKRASEIDDLILRIYEDNVSQKISDERFEVFSKKYEAEQKELKAKIPELENVLATESDKSDNLQQFIKKVKSITEPTKLTPELLHEFIEKIVVSAPRYLDGKRYQIIDVCYKGIGIVNELSPEEMEESFQRSKKRTAKASKQKEKDSIASRYTVPKKKVFNLQEPPLGCNILTDYTPTDTLLMIFGY